jgi:four helix bundle protein
MKGHRDLRVWQESIGLVKDIYAITSRFPDEEKFGLISQMRRSAVSIPSNIAEGAARGSQREFAQFLVIARGSLGELETQLIIAKELNYLSEIAAIEKRMRSLFQLLGGLLSKVKKKALA